MATTCITNQAKTDFFNGGMCLLAIIAALSGTASSTVTVTGLASTAGIVRGMDVTGANVAANTVVARILSSSSVELSKATTGAATSFTFTGDVFNLALIKPSPSGTYDQTLLNYGAGSGSPTTVNVGTDEVANGSGYTTGGVALTNVSAVLSGNTAVGSFSANPSWTSASFSTIAAVIYNTTMRMGAASGTLNNHTVSIHDFGGTQTVASGTFTLVIPTANSSTGLLRIA